MAASRTARALSGWIAGARFAASTPMAKTPSCTTCCTTCDNWSRNPDDDTCPAHHQRGAQRHRRRAPGLGQDSGSLTHSTRFVVMDRRRQIRGFYTYGEDAFMHNLLHEGVFAI